MSTSTFTAHNSWNSRAIFTTFFPVNFTRFRNFLCSSISCPLSRCFPPSAKDTKDSLPLWNLISLHSLSFNYSSLFFRARVVHCRQRREIFSLLSLIIFIIISKRAQEILKGMMVENFSWYCSGNNNTTQIFQNFEAFFFHHSTIFFTVCIFHASWLNSENLALFELASKMHYIHPSESCC